MVVQFFKPKWSWGADTDAVLRHKFKGKSILNFPCGESKVGNVRADIDPKVHPDIICDMNHPPFRTESFDVVICDPPKSQFAKMRWLIRISIIAKETLYLWTPNIAFSLKNFKTDFNVSWRPGNIFVRLFVVYKRKQHTLTNYN